MNKSDRKNISKWIETLEIIKSDIEEMKSNEECKYDNMPESLQESEKGEALQDAIEHLENATSSLEETLDELNEIA